MNSHRWTDPGTNYPCAAIKTPRLDIWCGYVGVPTNHPWFGLPLNAKIKLPDHIMERPRSLQGVGVIDLFLTALRQENPAEGIDLCMAVEVHRGLTYADDDLRGERSEFYWFGFDCGHAGDGVPGLPFMNDGPVRGLDYVTAECTSLAAQLHKAASLTTGERK